MDRDLTVQVLRPALWGAVAISLVLAAASRTLAVAGGFLAGAVWNVANLFLLRALATAWLREQPRRALGLLLTKLFVLYPAGLFLALSGAYSLIGMLLGFTWVFVVLIGLAAWPRRVAPTPLAAESRRG